MQKKKKDSCIIDTINIICSNILIYITYNIIYIIFLTCKFKLNYN